MFSKNLWEKKFCKARKHNFFLALFLDQAQVYTLPTKMSGKILRLNAEGFNQIVLLQF